MKTSSLVFLLAAIAGTAHGQTILSWVTFDAGGGTSSSPDHLAGYTVGQADAFRSASPNYAMIGGFWTLLGPTGSAVPPDLHISRAGSNVNIWWASPSAGFILEENPSLANPAGWSNVGGLPSDDGTIKSLIIPVTGQPRYFRLRKD